MSHPYRLDQRTLLITGASSGIGRSVAMAVAAMGAKCILTARNQERLNETLSSLEGDGHRVMLCDQTKEEELDQLIAQLPSLDGVVHSVGLVRPFPVKFIGKKQFHQLFDTNYLAPVLLTSKLLRAKKMNANGAFVFMSSISSHFPHKGGALYSGTKAALNSFSKTIALEYAEKGIRSNTIGAAMVKTPLFDEAEKAVTKELMDKHGEAYPLGFGEPEDVANAAVFLLSDASRWITGTELVMDGGLTAGQ